jgi:ubiquinone/menaquinone biosynthesis C-methylase UbiE
MKTAQQVAAAWSQLGDKYANSLPHKFGPSLLKLLALARPTTADTCLDVGTGTGHTAAQLAHYANYVYGLDPAEGMRQSAQQLYGHLDNLDFVAGNSEETGFPDNHFDIVTARHTLHHHPDIIATLKEMKRVLKPGGRLVIVDEVTPNAAVNDWFHCLEVSRDPSHQRAYFLTDWRRFIAKAGLVWIVGDAETTYTLEVESWIERTQSNPQQAEEVRQLFREASPLARDTFNIIFKGDDASYFDMPMAVILAIKPL